MIDLALDTRIFINSELDEAIQELDMIFSTENTELIGYPEYGTNWHQFLWQMDPSPNDLKKYVYEKISDSYFLSQLNVDLQVFTYDDNFGDMMYVVIVTVSDGQEEKTKTYQLK